MLLCDNHLVIRYLLLLPLILLILLTGCGGQDRDPSLAAFYQGLNPWLQNPNSQTAKVACTDVCLLQLARYKTAQSPDGCENLLMQNFSPQKYGLSSVRVAGPLEEVRKGNYFVKVQKLELQYRDRGQKKTVFAYAATTIVRDRLFVIDAMTAPFLLNSGKGSSKEEAIETASDAILPAREAMAKQLEKQKA